jgi:hypothetical protein
LVSKAFSLPCGRNHREFTPKARNG